MARATLKLLLEQIPRGYPFAANIIMLNPAAMDLFQNLSKRPDTELMLKCFQDKAIHTDWKTCTSPTLQSWTMCSPRIQKTVFPGIRISIIMIKRSHDSLILIMVIHILIRRRICIETASRKQNCLLEHGVIIINKITRTSCIRARHQHVIVLTHCSRNTYITDIAQISSIPEMYYLILVVKNVSFSIE